MSETIARRDAEMTPEARRVLEELFSRVADAVCTLTCVQETFGDFTGMSETHARAGVVVRNTVDELEQVRDGFEEWGTKYAPFRLSDVEPDGDV